MRLCQRAGVGFVAGRALDGRRLVEEHVLASHFLNVRMTPVTFHSGMASLQRELRSAVMIKERGCPPLRSMALGTGRVSLF